MSGLGDVGALLSVVASETPFQDAAAALQVICVGEYSSAVLTLKRLLQVRLYWQQGTSLVWS
jgi:hypothetical protein